MCTVDPVDNSGARRKINERFSAWRQETKTQTPKGADAKRSERRNLELECCE